MSAKDDIPEIPLPKGWPSTVKSAMLHIISLARLDARNRPHYPVCWSTEF